MAGAPPPTQTVRGNTIYVRRFQVDVLDGPDRSASAASTSDEVTIGTADGVDLRLIDPAVSRHHCALRATERGLELRDLGSTNGTFIGDVEIVRGFVRTGARIRIGSTTVGIALRSDEIAEPLASGDRFGELLGASPAMRRLYPVLERCAHSDITVLLQGETGTGKELVAAAIHRASPRRAGPFVVVDCGALPRHLTESELFGHARGAFTGADADRAGAFEAASGGTIFLDEVGELPLELQPLLLRALDSRTIRPVGANQHRNVDVRVIAASHRDLRIEVNARRFRADLFYRLHVMRIVLPPLTDRPGDIPLLAEHFWRMFRADRAIPDDVVADLARQRWPGNLRELRNAVERIALFGREPTTADQVLSHGQAKERANREWEQRWLRDLLQACHHNVSRAARTAQMSRSHLRELIARYGLSRGAADDRDDEA
jgi:two-component system response regulator GlrR